MDRLRKALEEDGDDVEVGCEFGSDRVHVWGSCLTASAVEAALEAMERSPPSSIRIHRLRALGNAVVPLQASDAFVNLLTRFAGVDLPAPAAYSSRPVR